MIAATTEIDFLHLNDQNLLLTETKNLKHKLIIMLLIDCGLRVSECVSLKLENFDFRQKMLYVESLKKREKQKDKVRKIPLSERLYNCLADYIYENNKLKPENYLFASANGDTHLSRYAVNKLLERFSKNKHNIPNLHPHALRHTFATNHLANKTPLENIKVMLGHERYDTTLIYAHVPDEMLKNNVTTVERKRTTFFQRLYKKYFSTPAKIINIKKADSFLVGRNTELRKINDLLDRNINVCVFGSIGIGKTTLLNNLTTKKKILFLDDVNNIKKSLIYLLLYLFENDKEAVKNLIFPDFDKSQIETKLNKESIPNLCNEILKLVGKHEYILKIDTLDDISKKAVTVLEKFKDNFTIITSARNISIEKGSFIWNFEKVELKPLNRSECLELTHKLSYDLSIKDYELYKNHIWENSNGNPRIIYEMCERYRKEPVLNSEVIRSVGHGGGLREIDMTFAVILFLGCLTMFRYMSRELDHPALKAIGAIAMLLLLFGRMFFSRTKRRFV